MFIQFVVVTTGPVSFLVQSALLHGLGVLTVLKHYGTKALWHYGTKV